MGCGGNQKQVIQPINLKVLMTPKGVLTVEILQGVLQRDTAVTKMDPYAQLKLGRTIQKTKTLTNAHKTPTFNEKFTWFINSDRVADGRRLEVTIWDEGRTYDKQVGFGIIDLDPIIFNKKVNEIQKCYLSYQRESAGAINFKLSFNQELRGVLIIRIMSASIRRKTSSVSDMKCVARFTIGEAVDETQVSKDTKQSPPVWKDVFRMYVIGSSMTGKLQVVDVGISGETHVGECEVDIKELMEEPVGKEHNVQILHENSSAGNVKFITAYVNLENVGLENRQRLIEQKEKELQVKESQVIEKEKEQMRKSMAKKAELKAQQQAVDKKAKESKQAEKKDADAKQTERKGKEMKPQEPQNPPTSELKKP